MHNIRLKIQYWGKTFFRFLAFLYPKSDSPQMCDSMLGIPLFYAPIVSMQQLKHAVAVYWNKNKLYAA